MLLCVLWQFLFFWECSCFAFVFLVFASVFLCRVYARVYVSMVDRCVRAYVLSSQRVVVCFLFEKEVHKNVTSK